MHGAVGGAIVGATLISDFEPGLFGLVPLGVVVGGAAGGLTIGTAFVTWPVILVATGYYAISRVIKKI